MRIKERACPRAGKPWSRWELDYLYLWSKSKSVSVEDMALRLGRPVREIEAAIRERKCF